MHSTFLILPLLTTHLMIKKIVLGTTIAGIVLLLITTTTTVYAPPAPTVFESDMTPSVGGSIVIRGITSTGSTYIMTSGKAELQNTGHIEVEVTGLKRSDGVIPVPTHEFVHIELTCRTTGGGTVTVSTTSATLLPDGDFKIEDNLLIPSPCLAPSVFVVSDGNSKWLATTGTP